MNRAATLEWERHWAVRAGVCAFAAAVLLVLATVVRGNTLLASDTLSETLREFDANRGTLLIAALLRGLALAAFAVPLYYLFRAASARSTKMRRGLVGIVIAGPLFLAVLDLVLWLALSPAANEFTTPGGGAGVPVGEYAEDLVTDQGLLVGIYQGVGLAGRIGFIFGVVYTSLWAMRTGLLTRFMGTLGMALGAGIILTEFAIVALVFWMVWVGLIILNRLPAGRPPAWDTGEAQPWPKAGDPPPSESREEEDVVEGEAVERSEDESNPNAARRERAKKRKRKRRA